MAEVTSIWNQIVGHEALKLRFERILSQNRLPQTLIFAGARGVGKNLFAWGLAQRLLCEVGQSQACGVCSVCRRIEKRQHESVLAIDGEGGSIKVEQARQVREWTSLARLSRARLVIFDPADWMNVQAANALLKLFEEPPEATYFILISNAPQSLPSTVRSRAQVFRFAHLSDSAITQILNISSQSADQRFFAYARGSVERARQWLNSSEQTQEILDCIEDFLKASRQGLAFRQAQALKELLGERDTQVLASGWFLTRVKEELLQGTSSIEFDEVASRLCSLESDLNRGFDKALLLEKLSLDIHQSCSS